MGIPVWITKEAYTELKQEDQAKQNNTNAVQTTSALLVVHRHNYPTAKTRKSISRLHQYLKKKSNHGLLSWEQMLAVARKIRLILKTGAAKLSTPGTSQNERKRQTETGASQSHNTSTSYDNAVASHESSTKPTGVKGPVSPEGTPLSAEQKAKSQQWLKDLQLACVQLGIPSQWANTIMIGRALSVTETAIILPATPLKLSTVQKRELWAQLISAARELNHSANGQ